MKRYEAMGKLAIINTMAGWHKCETCPCRWNCNGDHLCSETLRDYLLEILPPEESRFSKLRATMARQEWTAQALADEIGIEPYTMSMRLSGKSQWKRNEMLAICRVLGCTMDYLFGDE